MNCSLTHFLNLSYPANLTFIAMHRKTRCLALAEAWMHFSALYHVGKVWKCTNICLNCAVFNTLGVAMCRPQWACCQKAHRLALAEVWMHFSAPYHVGKVWKSTKDCLQRMVFIALQAAVHWPQLVAERWARRHAKRRITWPWWRREHIFLYGIMLAKCEKPQRID